MYHEGQAIPIESMARQGGFLMPVALFIIVVMGIAALALWRTTSQSSIASVQEVLTVQTLYAAESGVQSGLSELFYPGAGSRTVVDSRCNNLSQNLDFSGVEGLNLCQASVECELSESGFYTIVSEGRCGSGPTRSIRTLNVSARF